MKKDSAPSRFWPYGLHARATPSAGTQGAKRSNYSPIVTSNDTTIWAEDLENGERGVFKLYHHRGPISWWREKSFRFRVQREFEGLLHLERAAIPCTKPVYWSYGQCPGLGRCELLVTREIPQVITLHQLIDTLAAESWTEELGALYRLIRRMHKSGMYHGALYATNILVTGVPEQQLAFYIMDVPKAMVFPYDIAGTRMACSDLLNLSQNLQKRFGAEYCAPYLTEYGLSGQQLDQFLQSLSSYAPTKHLRNNLRAEFGARELAANFFRRRVDTERLMNAR